MTLNGDVERTKSASVGIGDGRQVLCLLVLGFGWYLGRGGCGRRRGTDAEPLLLKSVGMVPTHRDLHQY